MSDFPFRKLCLRFGAAMAVSEMVSANAALWCTGKSRARRVHDGEQEPRIVQIVGSDPAMMADAARYNVDLGAQIIDINMGCPATKVCNVAAGSSLLRDEARVAAILEAVVGAVSVPVTLKIRTGWSPKLRNATRIAAIAEQSGIQALAVHGRTRACRFSGSAEYDSIRAVKRSVSIPVIANGDITSPRKAAEVLRLTGADAVMIGRGAQGRPWIFRQVNHYLRTGIQLPDPGPGELADIVNGHLRDLVELYGEYRGVRIARKHLAWYCANRKDGKAFRRSINPVESASRQRAMARSYFGQDDRLDLAA